MMKIEEITAAVRAAIGRRDQIRDQLAERISGVARSVMDAARVRSLRDLPGGYTLAYRVPIAHCSQWGNMEGPMRRGDPCLLCGTEGEWRSFGPPPDLGYWDGANMQHQHGPTRDAGTKLVIRPATVTQLRALVRVLPDALGALIVSTIERAEEEAAAADAAIADLDRADLDDGVRTRAK